MDNNHTGGKSVCRLGLKVTEGKNPSVVRPPIFQELIFNQRKNLNGSHKALAEKSNYDEVKIHHFHL